MKQIFDNIYLIFEGVFGFAISANYSLTSPMLVNMVSIDEFSNAYGLLLMIQGVSNLVGPPFAGYLYDVSHIWYYTFGFAGTFIAISGILVITLPFVNWLKSCMNKSTDKSGDKSFSEESFPEEDPFIRKKETGKSIMIENKYRNENGMNDEKDPLNYIETEVTFNGTVIPETENSSKNMMLGSLKIDALKQLSPIPV